MCRWVLVGLVLLTVGFQVLGCPSVYVIIPEEDRCIVPRPVSDPTCEMAIIRAFLSSMKIPGVNTFGPGALPALETSTG